MVMKRYLIYYSYIGTFFRGSQRQSARTVEGYSEDPSTVQGLLEIALERLKPVNPVILHCASRTDKGVHALRSAAAVDLDIAYDPHPNIIQKSMNIFFNDTDLPIRVQDVLQVPSEFNPRRMPLWRKYIYRFATPKTNSLPEHKLTSYGLPIPITEYNRCYFVKEDKFDLKAVNEACQLFIGTHDFITFMGKPKLQPEDIATIRCLHQVHVEPSHTQLPPSSFDDYFNYWQLTCTGASFLYNQIRRTMTVLLAVGQGKLMFDDVQQMIMEPSPSSYPNELPLAPSCGLYLADIFYDPKDLALPDDVKENVDIEKNVDDYTEKETGKTKKELLLERLELLKRYKDEKKLKS